MYLRIETHRRVASPAPLLHPAGFPRVHFPLSPLVHRAFPRCAVARLFTFQARLFFAPPLFCDETRVGTLIVIFSFRAKRRIIHVACRIQLGGEGRC